MKLRIRGNSIRLRLLRTEVEQLIEIGRVTETTEFGASPAEALIYTLEVSSEIEEITARFARNQITVLLPNQTARDWAESEQISLNAEQFLFEENQNSSDSKTLKILIEKDFVCLDRIDDADNADAYPNPNKC